MIIPFVRQTDANRHAYLCLEVTRGGWLVEGFQSPTQALPQGLMTISMDWDTLFYTVKGEWQGRIYTDQGEFLIFLYWRMDNFYSRRSWKCLGLNSHLHISIEAAKNNGTNIDLGHNIPALSIAIYLPRQDTWSIWASVSLIVKWGNWEAI